MEGIVTMKSTYEVVKNVLTDFLGTEINNESFDDAFIGTVCDDDEIELLSSAVTEALESNK